MNSAKPLERSEAINNNRISHFGEGDPNNTIIEYYKHTGQQEKCDRFFSYRQKWEAVRSYKLKCDYPLEVDFAFNNRCNISCGHCYLQFQPHDPVNVHMPLSIAKSLLEESRQIGAHAIFFGNETEFYVYKHADEILQFASDLQFEDMIVATNGILLNRDRIHDILNSNVTRLYISIDALTKAVYEKVRSKWYYKLMENIFTFLSEREMRGKVLPLLRISFIDYTPNHHELRHFIDFWQRNNVDEIDVQRLLDVRNVNELRCDGSSHSDIRCTYPETMIYIDWNGVYRPCCSPFARHLMVSDISKMSILDAWRSDYLENLRDQLSGKFALNAYCNNCINSFQCADESIFTKK